MPLVRSNIDGQMVSIDDFYNHHKNAGTPSVIGKTPQQFAQFAATDPSFQSTDGRQFVSLVDDAPPEQPKTKGGSGFLDHPGDYIADLAANAPSSFVKHTAGALKDIVVAGANVLGTGAKLATATFAGDEDTKKKIVDSIKEVPWSEMPKAIWKDYQDYYGNFSENFKKDPFRAVSDLSTLALGAGAAAKVGSKAAGLAGKVSAAAKLADKATLLGKVADATDPLIIAGRTAVHLATPTTARAEDALKKVWGISDVAVDNKTQDRLLDSIMNRPAKGVSNTTRRTAEEIKDLDMAGSAQPYTLNKESLDRINTNVKTLAQERKNLFNQAGIAKDELDVQDIWNSAKISSDDMAKGTYAEKIEKSVRDAVEGLTNNRINTARDSGKTVNDTIGTIASNKGVKTKVHGKVNVRDINAEEAVSGIQAINDEVAKIYRDAMTGSDASKRAADLARMEASDKIAEYLRETVEAMMSKSATTNGLPTDIGLKWRNLGLDAADLLDLNQLIKSQLTKGEVGLVKAQSGYVMMQKGRAMSVPFGGEMNPGASFALIMDWLSHRQLMSKILANRLSGFMAIDKKIPATLKTRLLTRISQVQDSYDKGKDLPDAPPVMPYNNPF